MLRKLTINGLLAALLLVGGSVSLQAQSIEKDYRSDYDNDSPARIDRYLDVEVWTNHSDGEYFEGDNIVIHFRANRDAFVAIYSIDSRGRVNLLFPSERDEDNFIYGGVTYSLPGDNNDYDLVVTGPEGMENIQIVGSRERFDIPNWYHNSGLVCDWEDRADYMDYLNNTVFARYGGQRFAFDRAVVFVDEWEPDYYRPVYYPYYPSWTVYGNAYIDYPWGSSIYVNGIYWGCAPLYMPRIAIGWHTMTIYDRYGSCWESDFHVSRYNTVVFNKNVIRTSPRVVSKYKEVRRVGYRNPVTNGYPQFKSKKVASGSVMGQSIKGTKKVATRSDVTYKKSHVRGSTKVVKTSRGYETDASSATLRARKRSGGSRGEVTRTEKRQSSRTATESKKSYRTSKRSSGSTSGKTARKSTSTSKKSSSGYYQKKSGSSKGRTSSKVKSKAKSSSSRKAIRQKSSKQPAKSSGKEKKSSGSSKSIEKKSSGSKSSGRSTTRSQSSQKKTSPSKSKSGSKKR